MDEIVEKLKDLPDGFPTAVAFNIAVFGTTENEVRRMFLEDDDDYVPPSTVDRWLAELRSKGWFSESSTENDVDSLADALDSSSIISDPQKTVDGAAYLWSELMNELTQDENDFKHRVAVFDTLLKRGERDLSWISKCEAEDLFPFSDVADNYPWQGCKCVASAVMLFASKPDGPSKIEAIRPVSKSLGGTRIPDTNSLKLTRDPHLLSRTLAPVYKKAKEEGTCTALIVNTTDVEIMRNPGITMFKLRPGTYAHCFVMAVSPSGVYIFQGYGPRGYTLLQHMKTHSSEYPLSFDKAEQWVKTFEIYASDRGGVWNEEVNNAYCHCFGVDLVGLGCMNVGSQLDVYTTVSSFEFNTDIVRKNFNLLPRKRSLARKKLPPCRDGNVASAKFPPAEYTPNGGVKHYYIPEILRCGKCSKMQGLGDTHKRCIQCKAIYYCSKSCQRTHC